MTRTWTMLLAGCAGCALFGPAFAQTAGTPPPRDEASAPAPSQVAEIIVTSQKQSENLQHAPAAITAATGPQMVAAGITDLRAARAIVPGAIFQFEGNNTQVFLRGVGAGLDLPNIDQTVAFNFNGVYIPREGTSIPFFDVQQFEVLPGPQGTLYGRSSIGGAINVTFVRPTHELATEGVLEAGNYSLAHATLVQNLPLGDGLALRESLDFSYHDGYETSGADSQKDFADRLSLLYDKNPQFTAYVWAYYVTKDGRPANLVLKGLNPVTNTFSEGAYPHPNNPWDDTLTGPLTKYATFGNVTALNQTYVNDAIGGQFDFKIGGMTLSYIPSYFYLKASDNYWLGTFKGQLNPNYSQITQELRLSGNTSKIDWLTGFYAYQVNSGPSPFYIFPGATIRASDIENNLQQGVAVFGQATYHITDRLRATFGGRGSIDQHVAHGLSASNAPWDYDMTFRHIDYKVGFEYDVASQSMVYLTFQTGFQPGTYNEVPSTPTSSNAVKPEKLSAVTGGIKNRFFDNRVQVNLEGFHYDYTDLFLESYDSTAAFNPIFNAKKVQISGGQADVVFRATSIDQVNIDVAYTHAVDTNFISPTGQNFDGYSMPFAPAWQVQARYHHDFVVPAGYLRLEGSLDFESGYWGNFTHVAGTYQGDSVREDLSLTYFNDDGRWNLGLWAKNLSNQAVIDADGPDYPGVAIAYLQPPRTFGVRLGFKY